MQKQLLVTNKNIASQGNNYKCSLTRPKQFNLKPYEMKIMAVKLMQFFADRSIFTLSVDDHESHKKITQENERDGIILIHSVVLFLQDGR